MSLKQTLYFMTLAGGIAGLFCWVIQATLSDYFQFGEWLGMALFLVILGSMISGLTVFLADRWTGDKVLPRWVFVGIGFGIIAGFVGSLPYILIFSRVIEPNPGGVISVVGRAMSWAVVGGLIGCATGLRWMGVNKLRPLHALLGGTVGGLVGGILFSIIPLIEALRDSAFLFLSMQALSFVILGMGITLGVSLAPVLLRDGVLEFISSGDPRAQNKYGSPRQEWVLQAGDQCVIGSQSAEMTMTLYSRDVQVYLPDAMVSPRHAIIFERDKKFYIQNHPENLSHFGQAISPLSVDRAAVVQAIELRDGAEIEIGQTLLRFFTKKRASESVGGQASGPPRGVR